MNLHWNKNRQLLKNRFPQLYELLEQHIIQAERTDAQGLCPFPFWKVEKARNGSPTVRENNILMHSAYNPEKEAQTTCAANNEKDYTTAVFLGFGAGYLPNAFAQQHKNKTIILVEPDTAHFLAALDVMDWQPVFSQEKCILAIGCPLETLIGIVNQTGIKNCIFFEQKIQTAHAGQYFENFRQLLERNRQKDEINSKTLEKFAALWQRNGCRNLEAFAKLDGIKLYEKKAENLDAVVLAAGPSLADIIPHLAEIKKRSILICVDTALRACLKAGVEPDFIVIVDPQFWAAQHLAGLHSKSSVLITESAAYPSVFHFDCRKTVLCSSLFPLGSYFEKFLGEKGKIDGGGSVSTSAWNFANFIGVRSIYFAGLDLSYPGKNTHIKGSTFEEAVHRTSSRITNAATKNASALYEIKTETGTDYTGHEVLTDSRMKMFAWWFESRLARPQSAKTFTFCPQNLAVPGIKTALISDFLKNPECQENKQIFFEQSEINAIEKDEKLLEQRLLIFEKTKKQLCSTLQELFENARKAFNLCNQALTQKNCSHAEIFSRLSEIDAKISANDGKEIVALVFPTQARLEQLFARQKFPQDERTANLIKSKIIYGQISLAAERYIANIL